MGDHGLVIKKQPKYVWAYRDKIEETIKIMGKTPVEIVDPCEFGPKWVKLVFEER